MTAPKRCPICKTTDSLTLLKHPIDGYMKYSCMTCIRRTIPRGATVAMFDIRTERTRWYITITREEDITEMERIGAWAQEQRKNMVGLYVYNNWRIKTGCGPVSFSFGHKNSLEYLDDRVEYLREKLPILQGMFTEVSREIYQSTLDL